ncbi:MAG: L-seryl-tRNA(Sec) selenium transferase [Candidatus Dichloromethanomonas elyunquensis]|nr:MAG: L-seryl-tRNA(Sec) selenium transferase [Candidatus Dichloromethanomonas elyunquensis]
MNHEQAARLRFLPPVYEVVANLSANTGIKDLYDAAAITWAARNALDRARAIILQPENAEEDIEAPSRQKFWGYPLEEFSQAVRNWLTEEVLKELTHAGSTLKRIINATGVILHTNLGRALLAPEVAGFVAEQAVAYNNLELDVQTGSRGSRYSHVQNLLRELTGAEDSLVVNNNAAAVLLIMNTLANQKEVIVSRGELVEVGGAFRIPEVLKAGGAKLVEVGATNKTWLKDYQEAINSETAMLLKVHTSNYRIEGFHHSVSLDEIVILGKEMNIPIAVDLGSGSFLDGVEFGLPKEPTIQETVNSGASLVTFSGDKLLGGPQAGIIVGKKELIESLKKNQLMRAIRVDKLTLAALAGTLQLYQRGEVCKIPVWRMLAKSKKELWEEAHNLFKLLQDIPQLQAEIEENNSCVGGGAFPAAAIPTFVCTVKPLGGRTEELERFLRFGDIPILARIEKNKILLDPRTLLPGDFNEITSRLKNWAG